jgi:hypothetical protein
MKTDPLALQAEHRILLIRQHKVMLSDDLAALYGVEVKALNRAVRRNAVRFPEDFMFQLTREECYELKCQTGTSSSISGQTTTGASPWGGSRVPPYDAIRQLMAPPSANPKKEIGFHVKEESVAYKTKRTGRIKDGP